MPRELADAETERRLAVIRRVGPGKWKLAAQELRVARGTLKNWYNDAVERGVFAAVESPPEIPLEKPPLPAEPSAPAPVIFRPTYRIAQQRVDGSGKTRVLAIGDAHDGPTIPKDRFRWMGQLARETRPDIIVQIGDFCSLDSLCKYDANDTLKGKQKPSLKQDLDSFRLALDAFNEGLGDFRPEKHCTLGNHCDRMWSFVNRTPELADLMDSSVHTLLGDAHWNYSPYGALHFIGGVAFTHVPLGTLGKPYGGMHAENQLARDSLHDLVYGHSHKALHKTYPKIGGKKISVLNLGCALPEGHIEEYAKHSLTGWSWGIYILTIEHGHITMADWRPMTWLEEQYGKC